MQEEDGDKRVHRKCPFDPIEMLGLIAWGDTVKEGIIVVNTRRFSSYSVDCGLYKRRVLWVAQLFASVQLSEEV